MERELSGPVERQGLKASFPRWGGKADEKNTALPPHTVSFFSPKHSYFVKFKGSKWIIRMHYVVSFRSRRRPSYVNWAPLLFLQKYTIPVSLGHSWGYSSKFPLKLKLGINSHSFCSFHIKEQGGLGRLC